MSRPSISLCLIAKDEESNVAQLINSVEGCFDEIILVDTGSTDRTVEMAKALGCEVHHFEWVHDFSEARNFSFSKATKDYICWLDLDDVLQDKEGFIRFRDTAMGLAEYWIAPYHYSSDSNGKPMCSFARERVFKRSKGFKWKYFVHEGVMPLEGTKMQFTPSWSVKHMRTESDLLKDRSRNLNIFEKNLDKMDPRMTYYYGKELFEAQKPKEALEQLEKAIVEPKLELHDRILGFQYACYCYLMSEQYEKCIQLAHQGLVLAPNRAEFHSIIGDCYIKTGRLSDAVPYFNAAKWCTASSGGTGVIFSNEDQYTYYPRNQLARIYANNGDLAKGEAEAKESVEKYDNDESKEILAEIIKFKSAVVSYKDALPCEDIVISCPPYQPYEWDADIAETKAMGGSETACIEMARHLHKLSGRSVKVFNVREIDRVCDGVEYISTAKLNDYMSKHKPYLHIAFRHNFKITDAPTFVWSHDLITPGCEDHSIYEKILCLTPFHKRYMQTMQGVPEHKIHVTRNGIKPERFMDYSLESYNPYSERKNKNKIVFPSSPDRGLDRAMLVLDEVRKTHPDIELHVFYGVEHLHKYGLQSLADKLTSMMQERPWVKYHGATQQDVLMRHLKEAVIWLHPCDFIETSCITAMEMICAGVYPVTRRLGGLADTLSVAEKKGMATLIDSDCIDPEEFKLYIDATIEALDKKKWQTVSFDPFTISWRKVAEEWLQDLPRMAGYVSESA